MTLRETYARDICQNPGVPLEDCPRRDEHYALVDERLAGLSSEDVEHGRCCNCFDSPNFAGGHEHWGDEV